MNNEEKIKELQEKIKDLCMEVYGKSGDEIIELIKKSDLFFSSGIPFTRDTYTILLCNFFIERILKDKEKIIEKIIK